MTMADEQHTPSEDIVEDEIRELVTDGLLAGRQRIRSGRRRQ
jgi:hypothetical protein